jgi:hypothetical protein
MNYIPTDHLGAPPSLLSSFPSSKVARYEAHLRLMPRCKDLNIHSPIWRNSYSIIYRLYSRMVWHEIGLPKKCVCIMCFTYLYYISCLFQSTLNNSPNSTNAPDLHSPGNSDILISSLLFLMFDTTYCCHQVPSAIVTEITEVHQLPQYTVLGL